jgi:hypothetical protein
VVDYSLFQKKKFELDVSALRNLIRRMALPVDEWSSELNLQIESFADYYAVVNLWSLK